MTTNGDDSPSTDRFPWASADFSEPDTVKAAILTIDERVKQVGSDVIRTREEIAATRNDVWEVRGVLARVDALASTVRDHMVFFEKRMSLAIGRLEVAVGKLETKDEMIHRRVEEVSSHDIMVQDLTAKQAKKVSKKDIILPIITSLLGLAVGLLLWWLQRKLGG